MQFQKIITILFTISFCVFATTNTFATPWTFEIAPYLWATNMNGRVTIGPLSTHVDQNFTDIFKQVNAIPVLSLIAHHDRLGFYINAMYASLSNNGQQDGMNVETKNKYGNIAAGLSYIFVHRELCHCRKLIFEPYAGIRYTFINSTLNVNSLGLSDQRNVNWTDPVIGLQFLYDFNYNWGTHWMADIGGTNTTTRYSYNASLFMTYRGDTWKHLKTYFGYRLLGQRYQTGSNEKFYQWNVKLFGPVLGIGLIF